MPRKAPIILALALLAASAQMAWPQDNTQTNTQQSAPAQTMHERFRSRVAAWRERNQGQSAAQAPTLTVREQIRARVVAWREHNQGQSAAQAPATTTQRRGWRDRMDAARAQRAGVQGAGVQKSGFVEVTLAGRKVDIWAPAGTGAAPVILFSHGWKGCGTQSTFLTQALSRAGYLVVAPWHADASCKPELPGQTTPPANQPDAWTDASYRDRRDDMVAVLDALRTDPSWGPRGDFSRLGLMGHSLGGYTVLGLGGGWASWKIGGVKAILAMSPVCEPFVVNGNLGALDAPVSYQGGTRDIGITPGVKKPGGCYAMSRSPAHFVEFSGVGHLSFSDVVQSGHEDIVAFALAFFDSSLRGGSPEALHRRSANVVDLRWK